MRVRRRSVAILILGACLGAGFVAADADESAGRRVVGDPLRRVDLPCRHLELEAGVRLTEAPRSLRETFPYLATAPETVSSTTATLLVPKGLGHVLHKAPQEGGSVPAAVRDAAGALEAVRLFVAGPLVKTAEEGQRLIDAGRVLKRELSHLRVVVTDHRPADWTPRARPLPQDRSIHPTEAWSVSLVAFEIDRMLRMVHVTARVTAGGEVSIERTPIVDGPMTSWQTAAMGAWTEADERRSVEMHAEAVRARLDYAAAHGRRRDPFDVWAVARVVHDLPTLRAYLGAPERDVGSGLRIPAFDLCDGTVALAGTPDTRVLYIAHVESATGPMARGPLRGTWYRAPARRR